MKKLITLFLSIIIITLSSCNSKKTDVVGDTPITKLSYSQNELILEKNVALDFLIPEMDGSNVSCSVSPSLPSGLQISATTCHIVGIPNTVAPQKSYTVSASNKVSSKQFVLKITVNEKVVPEITYSQSIYNGTVNQSLTPINPITHNGNFINFTTTSILPSGIILNSTTGIISGTPTQIIEGTSIIIKGITDKNEIVYSSFILKVNDIPIDNISYPSNTMLFTKNTNVGTNIVPISSGGTPTNYRVTPALPSGLEINSITGKISGTPTIVKELLSYSVYASNSAGEIVIPINIQIKDLAPTTLSYGQSGIVLTKTVNLPPLMPTVGGGQVLNYSIAPTLPDGLVFNNLNGAISGTPTSVSAIQAYTITATNSGGSTQTVLNITVKDLPPQNLTYPAASIFFIKNTPIVDLVPSATGGNIAGYSISPLLPQGLSFNNNTGVISGTPQVITNTTNYTITASNSEGISRYSFYISVKDEAPQNLHYATAELVFEKGTAIANLLPSNDNGAIKTYTVSPTLPTGLILENTTGILQGTPSIVAERTKYTITGTNSTGQASIDVYITVNDKAPINLAYNNSSYVFNRGEAITSITPSSSGGAIVIYSISPALPNGMTFNNNTGTISGAPTGFQDQKTYTIYGTNSGGTISTDILITINDYPPDGLFYGTGVRQLVKTIDLGEGIVPIYTGGQIVYFTISPTLPTGLSFNSQTGAIFGTPTVINSNPVSYTITGYNSGGSTTASIQLKVVDLPPIIEMSQNSYVFTQTNNSVTIGSNIIYPIVSGGTPTSFSIITELSDPLFTGLTFNSTTGNISGTTSLLGSRTYVMKAQNDGGFTSKQFTITINEEPPTALHYSASSYLYDRYIPGVSVGYVPVSIAVPTHSGGNISTFSISPALPAGLSLNAATGAITGYPTEGGTYITYTITAANTGGSTSTTFQMKIKDLPPTGLTYSTNTAAAASNDYWILPVPTYSGGEITSFVSVPSLPSGIILKEDGSIERDNSIPLAQMGPNIYTITGSNAEGSTSATVSIQIFDSEPTDLNYYNLKGVGKTTDVMYFNVGESINYMPSNSGGFISSYAIDSIESIAKGPTYVIDNSDMIFTPISMPNGFSVNLANGMVSGNPGLNPSLNRFSLTISGSNNAGSTPTSIMMVINKPPVANAGSNFDATIGNVVSLNGGLSNDPDFDVDTIFDPDMNQNNLGDRVHVYKWSIISKPSGSLADINLFSNKDSATPSFNPDKIGTYVFGLIVNDYLMDSPQSTVTVTIKDVAPSNLTYGSSVFGSNIFVAQKNNNVTYTPSNTGGTVVSYAISPSLPSGMSFNTASGAISGTPTVAMMPTNYTITATNTGGSTSVVFKLWINEIPVGSISSVTKHPMPGILTLNGSISDVDSSVPLSSPYNASGSAVSYAWSIVSKPVGSTAILINANSATTTITPDKKGTYVFQLIVNDGFVSGLAVTKTITTAIPPSGMTYGTQSPFIANTFAWTENEAAISKPITVSGDSTITYSISGLLPSGLSFDTNTGLISGTPTSAASPSDYTITATNDGGTASINVKIWINAKPIANAGSNQTGKNVGSSVILDGSATSDSDNSISLSAPYNTMTKYYTWDVVGVPPTSGISNSSITNRNLMNASFIPDVEGDYYFRVSYFDGLISSSNESIVKIATTNSSLNNKIFYPIAHGGADEFVETMGIGSFIAQLNAIKSVKYTGTLTYNWSIVSQPSGSTATITNATSNNNAQLIPDQYGIFNLKLTVSDGTNQNDDYVSVYAGNVASGAPTGLMNIDTTFTKAGSPWELTGDIVIDSGATLTIEPGAVINGLGYNIYVKNGSLIANGGNVASANATPIIFKNTGINVKSPGTTNISLKHIVMEGGELCVVKSGTQPCKGTFIAKWSVFKNLTGDSQIGDTVTASEISYNSFANSSGLYVSSIGQNLDILNNCVYKANGGHAGLGNYFVKIINDAAGSIKINNNYFINGDSRTIIQSSGIGGQITNAKNNLWDNYSPNVIKTYTTGTSNLTLEPFNSRFDFNYNNDCRKYTIP